MLKKTYKDWASRTNERQKLQTIFAVIAVGMVVVAGLVSLINQSFGMLLLNIAYLSAIVWVVNFVTWAIFLAINTPSSEVPTSTARATKRK